MIDLAEKHISTYRPRSTEVRSVFTYIERSPDKDAPIPTDLDDPRWKEWVKCQPDEVESGHIADLAVHQAFRLSHPRGFLGETRPHIDMTVLLYDPAVHRMLNGRIISLHSTTYRFHPK